jgi:hypothetical protein
MKSFVARSRWAAFGAAVAVSLGGGAVFVANAVGQEASSFVAIEPCRLLDTREDSPVGGDGRIGPTADLEEPQLGTNDITVFFDPDAADLGKMGECGDLAIEAGDEPVAIVMNVTTVSASAGSFLTIYPWRVMSGDYTTDESARPFISQLNPWPVPQPITNSVTVALGDTEGLEDDSENGLRALRVYNHVGRVHVILDVVGYYKNGIPD